LKKKAFFSLCELATGSTKDGEKAKEETKDLPTRDKDCINLLDVDKGKFACCKNRVGEEQFPLSFSGRLHVRFGGSSLSHSIFKRTPIFAKNHLSINIAALQLVRQTSE